MKVDERSADFIQRAIQVQGVSRTRSATGPMLRPWICDLYGVLEISSPGNAWWDVNPGNAWWDVNALSLTHTPQCRT